MHHPGYIFGEKAQEDLVILDFKQWKIQGIHLGECIFRYLTEYRAGLEPAHIVPAWFADNQ
jgi:hypothetical protein